MKVLGIGQARVGSRRLRGKVLELAVGKSLLQHQIERVGRCRLLDGLVLACPNTEENWPIVDLAERLGIGCYRGSEEDVLSRVLGAAKTFGADLIVELTADCPLIDPEIVDRAVLEYVTLEEAELPIPVALVSTSRDSFSNPAVAYPRGMDVRVFRTTLLEEVDRLAKNDPIAREHVSLYLWEHADHYWVRNLKAPKELRDNIRLTVDTPDDLKLVRTIFEELYPADHEFGLGHILKLIRAAPELRRINSHVGQKAVR